MNEYKRMYTEASNDVSKFLANPINAYVLVKRLTTDWKQVENEITQNSGQGKFLFWITTMLFIWSPLSLLNSFIFSHI